MGKTIVFKSTIPLWRKYYPQNIDATTYSFRYENVRSIHIRDHCDACFIDRWNTHKGDVILTNVLPREAGKKLKRFRLKKEEKEETRVSFSWREFQDNVLEAWIVWHWHTSSTTPVLLPSLPRCIHFYRDKF